MPRAAIASALGASCVLACMALTGCVGARAQCRISVANASDASFSSVTVQDASGATYAFAGLRPHTAGREICASSDLSSNVTLAITAPDGQRIERKIELGREVPRTFDGCVVFQIESNAQVRAFILPRDERAGGGVMPWATPPSWQGVHEIPGLSGQE